VGVGVAVCHVAQVVLIWGSGVRCRSTADPRNRREERKFFIDNLLVRIHFIIVMIRWTGLAPWKFEFPFPGSLTSTFLGAEEKNAAFSVDREAGFRAEGLGLASGSALYSMCGCGLRFRCGFKFRSRFGSKFGFRFRFRFWLRLSFRVRFKLYVLIWAEV